MTEPKELIEARKEIAKILSQAQKDVMRPFPMPVDIFRDQILNLKGIAIVNSEGEVIWQGDNE